MIFIDKERLTREDGADGLANGAMKACGIHQVNTSGAAQAAAGPRWQRWIGCVTEGGIHGGLGWRGMWSIILARTKGDIPARPLVESYQGQARRPGRAPRRY